MTPEPLPGHEILTEHFLRQWGAVEGMTCRFKNRSFKDNWELWIAVLAQRQSILIEQIHPNDEEFQTLDFSAPLGTMAMVSTKLPEPDCTCFVGRHDLQHQKDCPSHPNNRLVKVLPGWLARLKQKPEGLIWSCAGKLIDWTEGPNERWQSNGYQLTEDGTIPENDGDFAYALPAHVLAEIEGKEKDALPTRHCPSCGWSGPYAQAQAAIFMCPTCQKFTHMKDCIFSTTISEEVKSCPRKSSNASSAVDTTKSELALGSNAAPPKSQPSEVAATWSEETMEMINKLTSSIKGKAFDPDWFLLAERLRAVDKLVPATSPTADEMIAWQESHKAVPKFMESGLVFLSYYKPDEFFYIGPYPTLRLAIANAMKEGK